MRTGITRRGALQGAAAVAGTGLLAACGGTGSGTPRASDGTAPAATGPAPVEPLAALTDLPLGTAVPVEDADGEPLLLVRTAETAVSAYSAVCPHSGCTVPGGRDELVCPCHGSTFTLEGERVSGPARRGLAKVEVTVVDGTVRLA